MTNEAISNTIQSEHLEGYYYHTYTQEDGCTSIEYQGRILRRVRNNLYLCEYYDWLTGCDNGYKVYSLDDIKNFSVYKTRKEMLISYADYCHSINDIDDESYEYEILNINLKSKEYPLDRDYINTISYAELMPPLYGIRDSINECSMKLHDEKYGIKRGEGMLLSDFLATPPPSRMLKAISDHTGIYLMGNHDCENPSYYYYIAWDRISSYFDVLHWFKHLLEKEWFDIEVMEDILVCIEKHRNVNFHFEPAIDKAVERKKVDKSLRYKILHRDGFKCRSCGRTADHDGVSLEIDHVIPLAKGGSSDAINLQVLCKDCNRGKHIKC